MTTSNDIRKAVQKLLKETYPNHKIYGEEVKQEMRRPCFFCEAFPVSVINRTAYCYKNISVRITYYPEKEADTNEDLQSMADALSELFGKTLTVGNRIFNIENTQYEKVDYSLSFGFPLPFYEGRSTSQTLPMVQEVIVK